MARTKSNGTKDTSTATIGFEAKLWLATDKLRNNMDAAEYKHVVLGLIFLKYISDTFEEDRAKLLAGEGDYAGANPEDPDEYKAENVFWVPADARWSHLQASAKQPTIGKTVDDAMVAIERDNPRLKGVLPKDYARPGLDKHRLGELIDLIATISLTAASEGEKTHRSVDLLGRVYDWSGATKTAAGSPKGERGGAHQYFLTRFASAEGKNGGQFYTPSCVVRCLVEMLAPYKGRIYDPACGSGGSLPAGRLCGVRFAEKDRAIAQGVVQSEKFVESHGGAAKCEVRSASVEVKKSRPFVIRNSSFEIFRADIGKEHADTFRHVQHPDLRADYVLANPPFNDSDTALRGSAFLQSGGTLHVMAERHDNWSKDDDVRWQFGVPPKGNANFAWVQHFIHHLAPQTALRDSAILQCEASPQVVSEAKDNMAGFVLANGPAVAGDSNQSGEGDIRGALIEADLVDCMVALPGMSLEMVKMN